MRRKLTIAMLFAAFCATAFADDQTGNVLEVGKSYYLYNVGQGKYLTSNADGTSKLSSEGTEFTVVNGPNGNYILFAGMYIFSTSFNEPTYAGVGEYNQWKFRTLDNEKHTYAIACLENEAYAYSYLSYSNPDNELTKSQIIPAMENGQWILTQKNDKTTEPEDPDTIEINLPEYVSELVFDENATEFAEYPEYLKEKITVKLYRTPLAVGQNNAFCVPFYMGSGKIKNTFGEGTVVYEFYRISGNTIRYVKSNEINAGKPYVVIPTKANNSEYYTFEDVQTSFLVDEPEPVVRGDYTFVPTFTATTTPGEAYIYNGNLRHYRTSKPVKGFSAYFVPNTADAKPITGAFDDEDEATVIDNIVYEDGTTSNIHTASGVLVRQNSTSTAGLAKGVYIVNGKKVIIK